MFSEFSRFSVRTTVWECPEMQDCEEGHFDAEEERGDADVDVVVADAGAGGDEAVRGGGEEGYYEL